MNSAEWHQVINRWRLPTEGSLQDRIEQMIRPALLAGYFGASARRLVAGSQSHLGGRVDTVELAHRVNITARDRVLVVGCFVGGAALELVESFHCRVTGVDLAPNCVAAANRIAELAGLAHLARFRVADAGNLPFDEEAFTVVWNQGPLENSRAWLCEFDRVLAAGGRMALSLEIGRNDSRPNDCPGSLDEVVRFVQALGYRVEHADDLTRRDVESGWKTWDRHLSEHAQEFNWMLGADWVCQAHSEFVRAIVQMECGEWSSGRIVARKLK